MILTPEEVRRHVTVPADTGDDALADVLKSIEQAIKGYTNNSFKRVLAANNGEWPHDIKMGVVKLIEWDLDVGKKDGIASETISRHSVTYANTTAAETAMGYPMKKLGFLKPYMRARFGQRSAFK